MRRKLILSAFSITWTVLVLDVKHWNYSDYAKFKFI